MWVVVVGGGGGGGGWVYRAKTKTSSCSEIEMELRAEQSLSIKYTPDGATSYNVQMNIKYYQYWASAMTSSS